MRRLLNLALLLAVISTCQAQRFLPTNCTALVDLLPPPPADDSPAGRADLETVLQVQADRTPEQVKRAQRVASQTVTSFARPVLGEWFQSRDFPRTMTIFEQIDRERRTVVDDQVKRHWNRTRPYFRSSDVHPVVGRPKNTSYPSGHVSAAALWGTILAAAFPEKAADFQAQIHEVMWCRVLGGAHYPSDTAAGELLGEAIARAMLKSPAMQDALKTFREEMSPHLKARQSTAPTGGTAKAELSPSTP
jgi:acid phosphatase (class A)